MSMQLNALLNERGTVWEAMKALRDDASAEGFTAEQRESWDKAEKRMGELTGDIERLQKASPYDELETQVRSIPSQATEARGMETASKPEPTFEERHQSAFSDYVKHGSERELRALSVGTNSAGGYTVPPGFRDVLIEQLKWYGNVRALATNIVTDSGQPLQWPTFNGTSQVGRILAENATLTETDPAFGTATLGAYMYVSDSVLVPYQFLQDTAIDAQSFIARILGTRIARIQNQHFTTGTGSSQPLGIQTNATSGVTFATGNTVNVTYAGLVALIHSVDPAYRNGGNAKFMAHDAVIAAFRTLVDSQNRPLWQPAVVAGEPDMILGYPIIPNNDLPTPAANSKSILFGDFMRGYVVRDVLDVQVRRLDERYADSLQVGWFGFCRSDATVQDAAAYKAATQSAT